MNLLSSFLNLIKEMNKVKVLEYNSNQLKENYLTEKKLPKFLSP